MMACETRARWVGRMTGRPGVLTRAIGANGPIDRIGAIGRLGVMVAMVALVALVAGCATTSVESRLSEDWTGTVEHLFVVAHAGTHWDEAQVQALKGYLLQDLAWYCPRVDVLVTGGLQLEPPDLAAEVAASGAPHVLEVTQRADKLREFLLLFTGHAGYLFDARLVRASDGRTVWRANLDTGGGLSSRDQLVGSMVDRLVERMLDDGLLAPYGEGRRQ